MLPNNETVLHEDVRLYEERFPASVVEAADQQDSRGLCDVLQAAALKAVGFKGEPSTPGNP